MLIPEDVKLYLYLDVTDMRKSIDTLCILVQDVLQLNPGSGHYFMFRNRQKNKIKVLYYEDNCFTLVYRRLEKGRFIFPKNNEGHIEMSRKHFDWLLCSDKYTDLNDSITQEYSNFC